MHYFSRFISLFVASLFFVSTGCTPGGAGPEQAIADTEINAGPAVNADSLARAQVIADSLAEIENIATADVYYAQCGNQVVSMADILVPIASSLQAQGIPYTRSQEPIDEWRDCSGNFLRLSSYVASRCSDNSDALAAPAGIKDYVPGGNNEAPHNTGPRSSRGLGQWYHDQARFIPIYYDDVADIHVAPQDLIDHRNLIKPGAVLWFSRQKPLSTNGLEDLWVRNDARTHINHMGTVTEVTRDEAGNVVEYKMYHGHGRDGNHASITASHFWDWPAHYTHKNGTRTKFYPPLGFWDQYLVGIGTLLPTEAPPAEV
ncbi:MAG: hypothetical protein AAF564_24855 [Bacteroidota bacterium]